MKKFLLSLAIFAFLSSCIVLSFTEIVDALKSGNAKEISKYFDNTVEITLPAKTNSYSKIQAESLLQNFFDTNGVKDFKVIHKSESAGSQYCIGNLATNNGLFRTTIYMKQKGEKQVIQELRFER